MSHSVGFNPQDIQNQLHTRRAPPYGGAAARLTHLDRPSAGLTGGWPLLSLEIVIMMKVAYYINKIGPCRDLCLWENCQPFFKAHDRKIHPEQIFNFLFKSPLFYPQVLSRFPHEKIL